MPKVSYKKEDLLKFFQRQENVDAIKSEGCFIRSATAETRFGEIQYLEIFKKLQAVHFWDKRKELVAEVFEDRVVVGDPEIQHLITEIVEDFERTSNLPPVRVECTYSSKQVKK